ncbi:hypothetical protein [Ureibacillus acetophenoni]|uniref:Permuted papain-like amidase YaeF/Yiix C92 family enzyme n=1 Tax=Ureibacillus acetophenoni TaxID=614649 RepID=A0A285UWC0_9BACL|nr:hypothetical protein [Ureibacillus acetophenoni]SOC45016.1 hypothetical protein SAMN05877842_1276 [Ureibacillus acetophenoni]
MTDKNVYILLTDTGTVFTRLIKLFTKKPYNHASICYDSNLNDVYSFGRKSVRNPFRGGFVKENLQSELFKRSKCAIYSFEVTNEQLVEMKQYIQSIEKQKDDYSYNLIGLFGFIIKKPIKRKNAFFCSQFVATVLSESNIFEFEKSPSLIAPHDFQRVIECEIIYEGKLYNYLNEIEEEIIRVPDKLISA